MGEETLIQEIARRVKILRQARGLRQSELADRIGLTCRHFQKLEAGEVDFRASTLARLAESLEICPSRLFANDPKLSEPLQKKLSHAVREGRILFWYAEAEKIAWGEFQKTSEILGISLDSDVKLAREQFTARLEPIERDRLVALLDQFDQGPLHQFEFECRFRSPHRGWIWLNTYVVKERTDGDGKPLTYFGFHQDITRWKRAQGSTYPTDFDEPLDTIRRCSDVLKKAQKGEVRLSRQNQAELLRTLDDAVMKIRALSAAR